MQLSRRGFLGGLLAVVSAPAIVRVESLMALPRPEIIVPQIQTAVEYAVGNHLMTMDMITREAIKLWTNSNFFIKSINEQYEKEFADGQARIGATWRIRLPADFAIVPGPPIRMNKWT